MTNPLGMTCYNLSVNCTKHSDGLCLISTNDSEDWPESRMPSQACKVARVHCSSLLWEQELDWASPYGPLPYNRWVVVWTPASTFCVACSSWRSPNLVNIEGAAKQVFVKACQSQQVIWCWMPKAVISPLEKGLVGLFPMIVFLISLWIWNCGACFLFLLCILHWESFNTPFPTIHLPQAVCKCRLGHWGRWWWRQRSSSLVITEDPLGCHSESWMT